MKIHKLLKKGALLAVLSLLLFSCSDNPSSSDDEAPEFPSFEAIQPDLSYFQNNNPQKTQQTSNNFNNGKTIALSLGSFTSFSQIYAGLFQSASQSGAELEDGRWVWDYGYSYQNESVSVVLTARESGNDILWDMTWSFQGTEESIDDYTVVEGRTAKDGSNGSWTFNSLDPNSSEEVPVLVTTWEKQSDSEVTIEMTYYDGNTASGSFIYTQDSDEHLITASDGSDGETNVYWNTDSMEGYYESDGERNCWDSNFQDTTCS